jgi:hypothetical protein
MDVVWNTAFGMDIDCQLANVDNPFLVSVKKFFNSLNNFTSIFIIFSKIFLMRLSIFRKYSKNYLNSKSLFL